MKFENEGREVCVYKVTVKANVCRINFILIPRYSELNLRSEKKKCETVFTHMPNLYIKIHINIKYMYRISLNKVRGH